MKATYLAEGNKVRSTDSVLEVKSFLGTSASAYEPYKEIVEQLHKIHRELNGLTNTLNMSQRQIMRKKNESEN